MPADALPALPVRDLLPELTATLSRAGAAVLVAPPGTGKTTLVPLALAGVDTGRVLVAEPRRVAARAAAHRMASLLGEPVGERVGYAVRGDRRVSRRTVVEVVTTGLLVRRLQRDPELAGTAVVVLDECHERHLDSDLALAFLVEARGVLRPELRLLATSATADADRLAQVLGVLHHPAPVLTAHARTHPVDVHWSPPTGPIAPPHGLRVDPKLLDHVAATTRRALADGDGDVLVFLPGAREIEVVAARLRGVAADVLPLHGRQSGSAQDAALRPGPRRRVVLATAVAESSLTVPGVRAVVDCGLSRVPRMDHSRGLGALVTVPVSRSSAVQRAGRAGREAPGRVYRCWSETQHDRLPARPEPEIASADLTGFALDLALWGAPSGDGLALPDQPPAGALRAATAVLHDLGAIDDSGKVTPRGRDLAGAGLHPRLARALLDGAGLVGTRRAAEIIAVLDDPGNATDDLVAAVRRARAAGDPAWRSEVRRLTAAVPGAGGAPASAPAALPPTDGPDVGQPASGRPTPDGPESDGPDSGGPDSGGPKLGGLESGGPESGKPKPGEPKRGGSESGGPKPSRPASSGPAFGAPASSGPAFGAPASSGPASGGPASGGPASGGPASGGPASGGPASGGPASGGPASGGPASGGPASGGPASGGPASGGPASGGPASGGPTSGGPESRGARIPDDLATGLVVGLAFPERVALAREPGGRAYLMAGGTAADLPAGTSLAGAPWLAVAVADRAAGARTARIRSAAPLDEETAREVAGALLSDDTEIGWADGDVVARRVRRLGAITLTSTRLTDPDPAALREALLTGLRTTGLSLLTWNRASEELRARLAFAHAALGDPWPDVSDAALLEHAEDWLSLESVRRRADLAKLDVASALRRLLPWSVAGRLDDVAPERLPVPSGSQIRVDYSDPAAPVLAVKVQEAFGWRDAPRLADGRVPVLLHLLSPAGRPVAVTRDLASFWVQGYPQVRAEMRGRYPRHPWPEDPLTAAPTRRANPRSR
ncbi:ATP-dependent helicase C-terminal domain-containing protein [Actinoplanes regularis]|uniref:ATP-dependent helicase C-terminal domain-containing protein n=2 Tax=Actinoplanes regularis TaxID=52697 RepID=UPI001FD51682|nr:ATP-dependent helicase C-terminal domain-containing protein [Actinoplanes regularis]